MVLHLSSGPGPAGPDPVGRPDRPGRRWLAAGLAVLALGGGLGGLLLRDPGPERGPAGTPVPTVPAPFPRGQSGVDYAPDRALLSAALPALLAGRTGPGASVGDLAALHRPAGLAGCLSALLPPAQPTVRPLALDYARFTGRPALVVVLPAEDPRQVEVFIVGPGCTAAEEHLLFYARLPRPSG